MASAPPGESHAGRDDPSNPTGATGLAPTPLAGNGQCDAGRGAAIAGATGLAPTSLAGVVPGLVPRSAAA